MLLRTLSIAVIFVLLAGCAPAAPAAPGVADLAAAQATQIVQQAQATALIQNARATAGALLASPTPRVDPGAAPTAVAATPLAVAPESNATVTPQAAPTAVTTASAEVRLLGLSFGADENLISVQFLAPVAVVQRWQQGNMYLIDEANGAKYEEIPVMPVVGALFARPTVDGQPGYVMFTNRPVPLQAGATVTVVLGSYRWEHVAFPSQLP